MATCKRLIAAFLAALCAYSPIAFAAFATAPTPPGFAGTPGAWRVAAQAGDSTFQNLLKKAPFTPKDYGGSVAKLGSGFRYGTLARRAAAGIIFAHPALRVAAGVAGWLALANIFFDESSGQWKKRTSGEGCVPPPGYVTDLGGCGGYVGYPAWTYVYEAPHETEPGICRAGWMGTHTSGTTSYASCAGFPKSSVTGSDPITTQTQFETEVAANPMPPSVPMELPPGTELPIEGEPVNNPGPGTDMTPQTVRIPVGAPVPQSDGTYKQPYVDLVPFPSPSDPWRVDVRPGDKVTTDGAPLPDPVPVKPGDPDPLPGTPPGVDPNDPTAKQRDPALQSLCEKHPGIAACAPYEKPPTPKDPVDPCLEHPERLGCLPPGELAPEPVANENKEITLSPDAGWGVSGSCPPPRHVVLGSGFAFDVPFDLLCNFATMIRPLIVAMAYLGAALMLVGAARRE